jgi:hypothetical protein
MWYLHCVTSGYYMCYLLVRAYWNTKAVAVLLKVYVVWKSERLPRQ